MRVCALEQAQAELQQVSERAPATALSAALLGPQQVELERRITALRALAAGEPVVG